MYARLITSHMKPEKFDFATKMFEEKVIPTLRKQKGFRDEISFVDKEHGESVAISFWDSEADALKYEKDVYPKMLETLDDRGELDTHVQPEVFQVDPKKGLAGLRKVLKLILKLMVMMKVLEFSLLVQILFLVQLIWLWLPNMN